MNGKPIFVTQRDYELPLLRLLYALPDGQGRAAEVRHLFEQKYGERIPDKHRTTHRGKEMVWENNINWCRNYLRERGFVDKPQTGIWRITEAGRQWIEENPQANRLPSFKYETTGKSGRKRSPTQIHRQSTAKVGTTPPGITLEMLENTKKAMPGDEFRRIWGTIYDQLLAEARAKAITETTDVELGQQARRKLHQIHSFLRGQHSGPPKSEVICDWIHLCYELDLNREAASLWQYVREEEVDSAYYRRAKRWAEASRVKLGW